MNFRFIWQFSSSVGLCSIRRAPVFTIAYMAMPLALLFLFGIVSGGALVPYAILGGAISVTAAGAMYTMSDAAWYRIELKMHDLLIASDVTVIDYMLGIAGSNFIFSLPGILVYVALGLALGIIAPAWLAPMAAIVLMVTMATSSIGFIVSSIPRRMRNLWAMSSMMSIIFTLVPPLFYPYSILPGGLLYLFMLSPVTPASIMLQNAAGLTPYLWYALPVLVIETVVLFLIAKPLTRWRTR
jgi:ABC-2 type transport system permease protein